MTHHIEITHMETYVDGSGLVAVISVDGVIFSGQHMDEEWDTETQKLQQQILNVGPVMDRSDLFDHEQTVFDQELNKLRLS